MDRSKMLGSHGNVKSLQKKHANLLVLTDMAEHWKNAKKLPKDTDTAQTRTSRNASCHSPPHPVSKGRAEWVAESVIIQATIALPSMAFCRDAYTDLAD